MKITRLKKNILNASVSLLLFMASPALAQLASWNAAGLASFGPSPWAATASDPNLTVGGLTRGVGLTIAGSAAGNAWGGNNWYGVTDQDVTFTVTANAGYQASYSAMNINYRRSTFGPGVGTFEYTFGNSSTTYTVINNALSFPSTTSAGGLINVNLSSIGDLQNVPAGTVVKFRIFPTGAGAANGTWYVSAWGTNLTGTVTSFVQGFNATIARTGTIQCNGQSNGELTANVLAGVAPYTYSWMPSGGTGSVATGLAAGSYTCIVTDAASATTSATYNLTQPAVLTVNVFAISNVSCNGGSNGSATITPTGGTSPFSYTWSPVGGNTSPATNLTAGNYTVNVKDSRNCTASQTLTITQPAPTLSISISNTAICNGASITVNAAGATTYTWVNGFTNNTPFSPTATAIYTVNTSNTITGCASSGTVSVLVNPTPTVIGLSNSTTSTICTGGSLTLNGSGAATYVWSGGVIDGVAFIPAANSSYTVVGFSAANCSATAVVSNTVNPNPIVTIVPTATAVCEGQSVSLTAGGAASYNWSTSESTSIITVTPNATMDFSLSGTDANNCSGTAIITITVNMNPTITVVSTKTVVCKNKTTTLTASGADTYSWSTNANTASITISPSVTTTYSLSATDVNGCTNTAVYSQSVSPCTGLEALSTDDAFLLSVFPNPNTGDFTIKTNSSSRLMLVNELGQVVMLIDTNHAVNNETEVKGLNAGIYFLSGMHNTTVVKQKIVVTR